MSSPLLIPPPRPRLARVTLLLAAVLAVIVVSAAAAEIMGARSSAEKVSADYVALLAHERVQGAVGALEGVLTDAVGREASGTIASVYEELPPLARSSRADSMLTCPGFSSPWYFRADFRDHTVATSQPMNDEAARRIASAVLARGPGGLPVDGTYAASVSNGRVAFFAVKYAPFGAPAGAYGIVTCPVAVARLLNAARAGGAADSLIRVSAAELDAGPHRYIDVGHAGGLTVGAEATAGRALGPVVQRDAVPPWALVALLVATIALGATAIVQARRDRAALHAQGEFVATVSHEMRTPLAQILLYAETLSLERVRSEAERKEAIDSIVTEARRLGAIVGNVVRIARADGAARVAGTVTRVAPVIENAVRSVGPLRDADVRIAVRVTGSPTVRADETTLQQIVANLLDNALKHGPRGQTVTVSAEQIGEVVKIAVEDEGAGIPPAERKRVWQRYARGPGATGDGAGIGLAVVRDLVRHAGGVATIETAAQGGARFVVDLASGDTE